MGFYMSFFELFKKIVHQMLSLLPDKVCLQVIHLVKFKRFIDFDNPVTFNEKVNWRKIYQRDQRYVEYADKILAKDLVSRLIGDEYIIPTLWIGDNPDEIPYESLEPPYVIKVNHSCGGNVFINDFKEIDKSKISNELRGHLLRTHGTTHREWAYRRIQPRILIERKLCDPNGGVPEDYKFFVFSGRVRFIQVDQSRFIDHRLGLFDLDWKKLPVTRGTTKGILGDVERPPHFDKLVMLAEKIGREFDFARVDFYDLPTGVFFW